jgi:hypothetical protein
MIGVLAMPVPWALQRVYACSISRFLMTTKEKGSATTQTQQSRCFGLAAVIVKHIPSKAAQASEAVRDCLDVLEVLGPDHPTTGASMICVAGACIQLATSSKPEHGWKESLYFQADFGRASSFRTAREHEPFVDVGSLDRHEDSRFGRSSR